MKKITVLTAMFCLCLQAVVAVFAATPNFAGNWELDVSKSKLPDAMQIESMTLTVVQTEKELSIQSATKRARGGMGNPMRRGDGNQTVIYSLEGKETNAEIGNGAMAGKETRRVSVTSDGKLSLTLMRSFNSETGGTITLKTNETWELMDEGRTLKVIRYMETPRGATNAELYFTKKSSGVLTIEGDSNTTMSPTATNTGGTPKKISGGVLNGKASSLPAPEYPAAARAVKASGAVNIQVTINEQGDIVSATAVSGHPLLRQAAEEAARKAKFAPTLLQGVPVSVTGVLVYNFVP
ncbi:MAG: TonB family protein [Acidobacteria bacterium]|nr:TonB family protein [Acidobacteriota bacterium]